MQLSRLFARSALALALGGLVPFGLARQGTTTQPSVSPTPERMDLDPAQATLSRMRDALARVNRLSFKGVRIFRGKGFESEPVYSAQVRLARSGAATWKIEAEGQAFLDKDRDLGSIRFHVGHSNGQVWSRRENDKVLLISRAVGVERAIPFLEAQHAAHAMPWDLLSPKPLAFSSWKPEPAPARTVSGITYETIRLTRAAANASDDLEWATNIIIMVDRETALPAGIVRAIKSQDPKAGDPFDITETYYFREIKVNEEAIPGEFAATPPKDAEVIHVPPAKDSGTRQEVSPPRDSLTEALRYARSDVRLLQPGTPAPDFSVRGFRGNTSSLGSHKGKVLVLDFWASWCPPCRESMPHLQRLHEKYKDKPVVFLGMNVENAGDSSALQFIKDNSITYPMFTATNTVKARYKAEHFPTFYIVSPDGKVVWGDVGWGDDFPDRMTRYIERELGRLAEDQSPLAPPSKK